MTSNCLNLQKGARRGIRREILFLILHLSRSMKATTVERSMVNWWWTWLPRREAIKKPKPRFYKRWKKRLQRLKHNFFGIPLPARAKKVSFIRKMKIVTNGFRDTSWKIWSNRYKLTGFAKMTRHLFSSKSVCAAHGFGSNMWVLIKTAITSNLGPSSLWCGWNGF